MSRNKREKILDEVCVQMVNRPFQFSSMLPLFELDGGYDYSGSALSREDFVSAWNLEDTTNRRGLAFFLPELIAYYCALGGKMSFLQSVCGIVSVFLLSDTIKSGQCEWDSNMRLTLELLVQIEKKIDDGDLFCRVLRAVDF